MRDTRPTQPMIPAVGTLGEVGKRCGRDDGNAQRRTVVRRANAPTSSGSGRAFIRQRNAIRHGGAKRHGPEQRRQRSETFAAARLPSSQNVMAGNWL